MISDINSNKKKWFDAFSGENVVKIGIARKAIRLFELMWRKHREGKALPLIYSEHAIPFLKEKFEIGNNILLADDSIYYGTTFKRVLTILRSAVGDNSRIFTLPVVMSEEAKVRLEDILNLPEGIEYQSLIIEKSDITNYVNNLTESFKELGKPYDIEFPLFYFRLPQQVGLKEYAERISNVINEDLNDKMPFLSDYYEVGRGCSVLLNEKVRRNEYIISTDFRKLRFFEDSGRCCIASYAPKFIPDGLLVKDSLLFKDTPLMDIWNEICDSIYEIKDDQEYTIHSKRTLVICANYLFSFISFLEIKDLLDSYEGDLEIISPYFKMDIFDITLLVGDVLAPRIERTLMNLLDKGESINMPLIGTLPIEKYEVLPEKLVEDFSYHFLENLNHCKSISEFVSIYFSNQYRWIDTRTKSLSLRTNERFNFGIGFESLLYKANLWNSADSQENVKVYIHKAIDARIDEGSVVPRYIMDEDSNGHVWLRLFRCGENDDKYVTRLHKLALKILLRIKDKYYGFDEFPKVIVEALFNIILGNLVKDEKENGRFSNLGGIDFELRFDKDKQSYSIDAKDENGSSFSVYDTCIAYKLIKSEGGFCSILDTEYVKYLQEDDCLDDRYRRSFNQCIDFIVDLSKVTGGILLTKMVNLLKNANNVSQMNSDININIEKYKLYLKGESSESSIDKIHELYFTYPFASVLLNVDRENVVAQKIQIVLNENNRHNNGVSLDIKNFFNINTEQIVCNQNIYQNLEFYYYMTILESKLIARDTSNIAYLDNYIKNKINLPAKLQDNLYQLYHKNEVNYGDIRNTMIKIIEKYES